MNNIDILDLVIAEQIRITALWRVRNSISVKREEHRTFLKNQDLIDENRKDFNEVYDHLTI